MGDENNREVSRIADGSCLIGRAGRVSLREGGSDGGGSGSESGVGLTMRGVEGEGKDGEEEEEEGGDSHGEKINERTLKERDNMR